MGVEPRQPQSFLGEASWEGQLTASNLITAKDIALLLHDSRKICCWGSMARWRREREADMGGPGPCKSWERIKRGFEASL